MEVAKNTGLHYWEIYGKTGSTICRFCHIIQDFNKNHWTDVGTTFPQKMKVDGTLRYGDLIFLGNTNPGPWPGAPYRSTF